MDLAVLRVPRAKSTDDDGFNVDGFVYFFVMVAEYRVFLDLLIACFCEVVVAIIEGAGDINYQKLLPFYEDEVWLETSVTENWFSEMIFHFLEAASLMRATILL